MKTSSVFTKGKNENDGYYKMKTFYNNHINLLLEGKYLQTQL